MRRLQLTPALAVALAAACGGEPLDPAPAPITGNHGDPDPVGEEPMRPDAGRYRAVMEANGCTATVIAPHAVVTAYHCVSALAHERVLDGPGNDLGPGRARYLYWRNAAGVAADDLRMEIAGMFGSPHAINKKYYVARGLPVPAHVVNEPSLEVRPFAPSWWGGSTTLPHPHDLAVFFVPDLSAEFIAENQIPIETVDGLAVDRFRGDNAFLLAFGLASVRHEVVGRMGGASNQTRRFGPLSLDPTDHSMPGQLRYRAGPEGFVHMNQGDSGGPTFAKLEVFGVGTRVLAATTKSGYALGTIPGDESRAQVVPLAYLAGMSFEHRDAVRLNHLWLKARRDDADDDGWPLACDADPSSPHAADRLSRCPSPVGRPLAAETKGLPQGSLLCPDGWIATALLASASNAGLHELELSCQRRACVEGSDPASCETRSTDRFGLDDPGLSATRRCPNGQALRSIDGTLRPGDATLGSLGGTCGRIGSTAKTRLARAGEPAQQAGGASFARHCPSGRYLQGLIPRMTGRTRITGLQPVCTE